MFLKSIHLTNFLSFGSDAKPVPLGPLNVVIGPNGSGKSNLIEALAVLQSLPRDIDPSVRNGGSVRDWVWKGMQSNDPTMISIDASHPSVTSNLRYLLEVSVSDNRLRLNAETIFNFDKSSGMEAICYNNSSEKMFFYRTDDNIVNNSELNIPNLKIINKLKMSLDSNQSIISQLRDPAAYPFLTDLGIYFSKFRIYREWSFGRNTAARAPQDADQRNHTLDEKCKNLGMVLNRLRRDPAVKRKLLTALQTLYPGITDFDVQVEGGTVQIFLEEGKFTVPASRLSDGTLRYLCLLAILLHPEPPPLVCIEEPELGLHPDVLPTLAELMKEASTRMQLIVTTHSDVLVDAMTDCPEVVLVAEKDENGTTLTRLDAEKLKPWLAKYRLGQLWTRGEIGGTRW